ncbi:hypothetical protein QBC47DRAFT_72933 [Echria macrotheca]|uniref:intramembrane prenyl-peptidase Rce1 n=1 Tax=Echria macrotheca TaxID=438768 RepID=A0AAJ0F804_9PEZI|nr:hypothetical protein QBC47DRAFT_72933 [Echria macrotheca]
MPALLSLLGFRPLADWWHKDDPPPPPITTGTASLLLVLYALAYFLPFYASSTTRPSPTLSRDAPSVIRARIRSVTLTCVLCTLSTFAILSTTAGAPPPTILHLTGIWPAAVVDALRALLLTALLFAGPLFHALVVESGYRPSAWTAALAEVWTEWPAWRNLVAGPVTEEVLFRSASVPLMLVARTSLAKTILLSPIIFGLAHVHHFYEFRLSHPQVPPAAALARSVVQFAYTTLFGAYATFLFLRSGSLLAVCLVHTFCNCMGLPKVWGRIERPSSPRAETSILWTVTYYTLLVAGAVAWYRNLWILTESGNSLVPSAAFA